MNEKKVQLGERVIQVKLIAIQPNFIWDPEVYGPLVGTITRADKSIIEVCLDYVFQCLMENDNTLTFSNDTNNLSDFWKTWLLQKYPKPRIYSNPPSACELCRGDFNLYVNTQDTGILAVISEFFDCRTRMGHWGNLCTRCFNEFGIGLGLGKGQRYREYQVKGKPTYIKIEG